MTNEYRFGYDEMLIQIQACVPDSQNGDGLAMTMARAQWISQVFVLCTLGNSLARDKGWRLWGMDAIEYALMRRYSWPLETIRDMPIRDRWLALHEELADLQWDEEAQQNYAEWTSGDTTYKIWLEDEKSLEAKLKLMKDNGLAGTAEWALGQETSGIWDLIRQYIN